MSIPEVCVSVKRDLFTWQKRPIEINIPALGGACVPTASLVATGRHSVKSAPWYTRGTNSAASGLLRCGRQCKRSTIVLTIAKRARLGACNVRGSLTVLSHSTVKPSVCIASYPERKGGKERGRGKRERGKGGKRRRKVVVPSGVLSSCFGERGRQA